MGCPGCALGYGVSGMLLPECGISRMLPAGCGVSRRDVGDAALGCGVPGVLHVGCGMSGLFPGMWGARAGCGVPEVLPAGCGSRRTLTGGGKCSCESSMSGFPAAATDHGRSAEPSVPESLGFVGTFLA